MSIHAIATLNLRLLPMLANMKAVIVSATQDLFEEEIVPTAKDLSPVTEEGYARNVVLKAEHKLGGRRVGGTGTNRRSIDSAVSDVPEGVKAQLFTQSGYGGYLELGTGKMRAQPYLNPAFDMHIGELPEKVKEKLGG
jgi:HK97 gp10 family phage protein